jgi:hypothetical protein
MCRIKREYSWQHPGQVGPATGHSMRADDDMLNSMEDAGDRDCYNRLMKTIRENPANRALALTLSPALGDLAHFGMS